MGLRHKKHNPSLPTHTQPLPWSPMLVFLLQMGTHGPFIAHPYVEVRRLPFNHIARQSASSAGVFAVQPIPANTLLFCYTGFLVCMEQAAVTSNQYQMEFNRTHIIDARFGGNISRFINSPKGLLTKYGSKWPANVYPRARTVNGVVVSVDIYSSVCIQPNHELLMNYGRFYTY
jgi:SET domain-containing protein